MPRKTSKVTTPAQAIGSAGKLPPPKPTCSLRIWQSSGNKQWYWHFWKRNGQIVDGPGEGFKTRNNAVRSVQRHFRDMGATATIDFRGCPVQLSVYDWQNEQHCADFRLWISNYMEVADRIFEENKKKSSRGANKSRRKE